MLLLAETAPDTIKPWLECLAWFMGFVACGVWIYTMLRKSDATPQPFIVQAHEEYTPLSAHIELKNRVDKVEDSIRLGFERLDQKRSVSIAGLHEDLQKSCAAIRGEVKLDVGGLHTRVNDVLKAVSELSGRVAEALRAR